MVHTQWEKKIHDVDVYILQILTHLSYCYSRHCPLANKLSHITLLCLSYLTFLLPYIHFGPSLLIRKKDLLSQRPTASSKSWATSTVTCTAWENLPWFPKLDPSSKIIIQGIQLSQRFIWSSDDLATATVTWTAWKNLTWCPKLYPSP